MADILRPTFDPVDTSFNPADVAARDDAVVESPSLSSSNALARFEFEPGRSKDGTKVLMVEWEDDDTTKGIAGDWEVSWDEKKTVLPARDHTANSDAAHSDGEGPVNRLYFLLGPGIAVPAVVRLQKGEISWKTSPLPAIFSPELGATARQSGKKGVLHTIWAKKRLQVLQSEIENELKDNSEGIALEMAVTEKEWIEQNFGVVARPSPLSISGNSTTANTTFPATPTSPRSPGGSRLMDKLKGLRLGTTAQELAAGRYGTDESNKSAAYNPLSPDTSDVAIGGFGSFVALKGPAPDTGSITSGNAPPATQLQPSSQPPQQQQQQRKIVAQRPPDSFAAQQHEQMGMGSLNAAFAPTATVASVDATAAQKNPAVEGDEDDLFALPMSPRSPEMTKSPFSFHTHDTMRYLPGEKA